LGVAFVEKIHHRSLPGLLAQSAGTMLTQTIVVLELGCSFGNRRTTWPTRAAWLDLGKPLTCAGRAACRLPACPRGCAPLVTCRVLFFVE
jgi:hypothetical protein